MILEYLKKGGKLTPLKALRRFNCLRLGARIYDLRAKGHPIKMRMKTLWSGKRVAEYWIDGEKPYRVITVTKKV
ncbi:MAG: helix-turn-helix domain-containing protein [Candidatus Nanoarchaeia archaeon]|nr:helix-turn-helix domain-containing protein [Candidatus Nanoarchaeia archaeon]